MTPGLRTSWVAFSTNLHIGVSLKVLCVEKSPRPRLDIVKSSAKTWSILHV